ncbi:MAG: glycosyltransferase family 4 protein [Lachnospiraceae bacterium]|nr:glycosyltransferase family 4 protein [Lachnospiraceae bacterium]
MRVLWLCNIMLPVIAMHLGKKVNNKEGWLSGTFDRLKKANFRTVSGERIELGVCFPVSDEADEIMLSLPNLEVFGFYEDTAHPEVYDAAVEIRLKRIVDKFNPDLVHCFGTEYPHTLAMTKAFPNPDKILVGIQGLCYKYAEVYMANLPMKVQKSKTFRDILKKDSLIKQKQKFVQRGEYEKAALKNISHVTGRTHWDFSSVAEVKEVAKDKTGEGIIRYHFMNETLRNNFYEGSWDVNKCIPYSLFISQGDYPIKGLHFMLQAMPRILEKYPDTTVWVSGNNITKTSTLIEKIKISAYGRYLKKLIKVNKLQEKVHFLGRLDAKEMKERFLKSHLYVCPSAIENSPNSLGEAMILGVPAIASDTGGISSVFCDKKDGLLFEMGNYEALADGIIRMFSEPEKMKEYSENAKKHAGITHNPDENYKRLLEIYQEIVCR